MWAPRHEAMPAEQLRELQTELVATQLRYVAERSGFYQEKWAEAGFDPSLVKSLEDLRAAPFTEKDELRRDQLQQGGLGSYACAATRDVVRVHSSSGTTGRPSFIGITRSDSQQWTESLSRVFWCVGVRPDDTFIHGAGLSFFVGGLPVKDAIENIGATFVPIGTGASERLVAASDALGGTVLFCTPSYALYLAEFVRERLGRDPASLGFRRIVLGAEPGGGVPAIRERIMADYECLALEAYGNSDVVAAFAANCDQARGNHIVSPDFAFLELIDPETTESVPWGEGARGELVSTNLGRECCPLVRFRTRDHVTVSTDPCECGRTGPRIVCVGRTDDMLIVAGVNVWPSAINDVVGSFRPRTTGAMRILVDTDGPAVPPPLKLRVETTGPVHDDALAGGLTRAIRDRLQVPAVIELVEAGTLPRFEMKASYIERRATPLKRSE